MNRKHLIVGMGSILLLVISALLIVPYGESKHNDPEVILNNAWNSFYDGDLSTSIKQLVGFKKMCKVHENCSNQQINSADDLEQILCEYKQACRTIRDLSK